MSEIETKAKRTRTSVPAAVYPEKPTRIVAIDGKYIKEYFADNFQQGNISREELEGWNKLYTELVEEYGERSYFMSYRNEFVKAYFPELLARINKPQKKESMGDFIASLLG